MIMSRFKQEISGSLGEFWKKEAEKELAKKVEGANKDAIVDEDGAIKWKCNGNYLMNDYCEILEYANYPFSRKATCEKRQKQTEEFFAEYRKNYTGFSDEEKKELDANNKPGTKIVNVITGTTYITR